MGEIQVREARAGEYEGLGSLIQRAYAEYARPGEPLWDGYFSMLAGVAGRAAFATVLVAVAGGHVIGTATVELDTTIEGTQDLHRPGRLPAPRRGSPRPRSWRGRSAGSGMHPGRPRRREGRRHTAHHRSDDGRSADLPVPGL